MYLVVDGINTFVTLLGNFWNTCVNRATNSMTNLLLLKVLIAFIFLLNIADCNSQIDSIYFSTSGDTVLYSFGAHGQSNSDTFYHQVIIASFNPKDTIKVISSFEIPTTMKGNALKLVSKDTIKKYNLQYDGVRFTKPDKNIKLKVSANNIVLQSQLDNSSVNIYKADISIYLKCKSKLLRNEKLKYMFKGLNKTDINTSGICDLTFWKKNNKDKYLIYYRLVRNKKITKDGNGDSYDIISYLDYY